MIVALIIATLTLVGCIAEHPAYHTEVSEDEAARIMEERVRDSYMFKEHEGYNLNLKEIREADPVDCVADFHDFMGSRIYYDSCYDVTYGYMIPYEETPQGVTNIEVNSIVRGQDISHYSYTEEYQPVPINCDPANDTRYLEQERRVRHLKSRLDNLSQAYRVEILEYELAMQKKRNELQRLEYTYVAIPQENTQRRREINKRITAAHEDMIEMKEDFGEFREGTGIANVSQRHKEATYSLNELKREICLG